MNSDTEVSPKGYEISLLNRLDSDQLLGPLVRLAYPDVLYMRLVSRKFRDIIDSDYFWKLKTQRDFGVRNEYPSRFFTDSAGVKRKATNWREEYLSYGQTTAMKKRFLTAVSFEPPNKVQEFLDLGVSPNVHDKYGNSALAFASYEGRFETVKMLLDAGANVNVHNGGGKTPLMAASDSGNSEIVKLLLIAGAYPNAQTFETESTALIIASKNGYIEIVRILLEANANVNTRDKKGKTALTYALKTNFDEIDINRELVDLLKSHGARN